MPLHPLHLCCPRPHPSPCWWPLVCSLYLSACVFSVIFSSLFSQVTINLHSVSVDLPLLDIAYKWNCSVCICVWLFFFFFFNIYLFPCARSWLPHVGSSSLTRDWPRASALGAWGLSRWTTKEALCLASFSWHHAFQGHLCCGLC